MRDRTGAALVDPADNATLLSAFAVHQAARGLARTTVARRRYSLNALADFITPLPLSELTPELLDEWLAGYGKAETRSAYLSDARALFRWARRRRIVDEDPTQYVDRIRRSAPLPSPMPERDLARAIEFADRRLRVVLLLGAYAGLRRFEVASLRAEDCTDRHIIVRHGKGDVDRALPNYPELWAAIQVLGVQHGWLFPAPGGGHVKPATIGTWIRRHYTRLGIRSTLHKTRHRFGTGLSEAGASMEQIKVLMGHKRLSTTEGYVAFNVSGLDELVRRLPAPPPVPGAS